MRAGGKGANFTALRHKRGRLWLGDYSACGLGSTNYSGDLTLHVVHQIDMDNSCYGIYAFSIVTLV